MQHEFFNDDLKPEDVLFIRLFLTNGLNGTKAAMHTFGMSHKHASSKSNHLLKTPRIIKTIREVMEERMQRLKIDADWVLAEAVEVYQRCMKKEKTIDRDGNFTGEFRFDATNSLKALDLIGKHTNVKAFEERSSGQDNEKMLERLKRGRDRAARSSNSIDDEISFLAPP